MINFTGVTIVNESDISFIQNVNNRAVIHTRLHQTFDSGEEYRSALGKYKQALKDKDSSTDNLSNFQHQLDIAQKTVNDFSAENIRLKSENAKAVYLMETAVKNLIRTADSIESLASIKWLLDDMSLFIGKNKGLK